MQNAGAFVLSLASAFIGLAIISVLLSTKSNTSSVITSAGSALSGIINAAVSPITGGTSASL